MYIPLQSPEQDHINFSIPVLIAIKDHIEVGSKAHLFSFMNSLQSTITLLESSHVVCLIDLILYVPSTIFQLNRDGSSWVEPVLS